MREVSYMQARSTMISAVLGRPPKPFNKHAEVIFESLFQSKRNDKGQQNNNVILSWVYHFKQQTLVADKPWNRLLWTRSAT